MPGAVDRLTEVIDKLLVRFKLGPLEKQTARGFLQMFAKRATDADVAGALRIAQDEIIPYVLTGHIKGWVNPSIGEAPPGHNPH